MIGPLILDLAHASDLFLVGGKAAGLGALIRAGARVPDGQVITTACLVQFLSELGIDRGYLEKALQLDPSALSAVRTALSDGPWPSGVRCTLEKVFLAVGQPACVRSSAVSEDGVTASYAGIFRSWVNVRSVGEFLEAVRDCWTSTFETQAVRYAIHLGVSLPLMALVVQPLIHSTSAGVAFLEGRSVTVAAAYGMGLGVVSGRVPVDRIYWATEGAKPKETIRRKHFVMVPNNSGLAYWPDSTYAYPLGNGSVPLRVLAVDERQALLTCEVPDSHSSCPVLSLDTAHRLVEYLLTAVTHCLGNGNWDIEWCLDLEGNPWLLQARPITAARMIERSATPTDRVLFAGEPVSPGVATGPARFVSDRADLEAVQPGDVLVMEAIPEAFLSALALAAAVVLHEGDALSHCAIVAREWGVPCVSGAPVGLLAERCHYSVNGTTGEIAQSEISGTQESTKMIRCEGAGALASVNFLLGATVPEAHGRPAAVHKWLRLWRRAVAAEPHRGLDLSGLARAAVPGEIHMQVAAALVVAAVQIRAPHRLVIDPTTLDQLRDLAPDTATLLDETARMG